MIILNKENNQKRNIVLTIYLYFTLFIGIYFLKEDFQNVFNDSDFDNVFLLIVGVADIIFTFMILDWRKFGFYGLLVTSLLLMIFNLISGYGLLISLLGFFGFIIIFLLLQLKKKGVSGWKNLK
ncbi:MULTISPECIES: hypothetical protein [unclassified Arenibacter]|uniref:hypothetical protein n=1 Tax=unclassified Arenibacter TaxID=2615047 RepID=UPI000E340DD5|nr:MULTISPECIES: hypothetical protein [unclassified Arenibacter]MCM4166059.1 hypothetical protein [Arenibacter sp. A80]RFT54301.1 hypothetical protein D0S24_20875 [Arenibacter sp. P308M17]